MTSFRKSILAELEAMFDQGQVTTLTARSDPSEPETKNSAVKLGHNKSGVEIVCDEHDNQIENNIVGLVRLLRKLNKF